MTSTTTATTRTSTATSTSTTAAAATATTATLTAASTMSRFVLVCVCVWAANGRECPLFVREIRFVDTVNIYGPFFAGANGDLSPAAKPRGRSLFYFCVVQRRNAGPRSGFSRRQPRKIFYFDIGFFFIVFYVCNVSAAKPSTA